MNIGNIFEMKSLIKMADATAQGADVRGFLRAPSSVAHIKKEATE
jgi:hypothetical protein